MGKKLSIWAIAWSPAWFELRSEEVKFHTPASCTTLARPIPDGILGKPGNLTSYEWDLVKRHPVIGAEILHGSASPLMQAGEIIALTHHERWDGSGYPYGLQGEDIPLSGRICAVADVFDALTTRRTYKEEISVADALDLVVDSGGCRLTPRG
jgi:putative two-component system response regulator